MNLTFQQNRLDDHTIKFSIMVDAKLISFTEAIYLLLHSDIFKTELTKQLIDVPFDGFFWEVKSVKKTTLNDPFEFVVVNSRQFATLTPDSKSFDEYFTEHKAVVSFSNLGGDAKLIVPTKMDDKTNYGHLAGFLRTGQNTQINEFWKLVGSNYQELIGEETLWLSTAGLGVPWLHIRFDKRPKYYRHDPYK